MKRSFIQFLSLFIILSFTKCSLQPLQPQQATEHFYTNVKQIVTDQLNYQINQDFRNSEDSFSLVVYNDKTYASTIGMRFEQAFNAYAKKKGIFTIKGVHSQEITKYIFQYYQEEIDMQMQLIPELILRQGELELDSNNNQVKNPFFLHLIQDIRMSIIDNNKSHKIEFDIEQQQNESEQQLIVMSLKSRESILARISVHITSQELHSNSAVQKKDFFMNVLVENLAEEDQESLQIQVPMISRNVNEFKLKMTQIHNYLNLDSYSNNNKEHYLNLIDFLSKQFKGFSSRALSDLEKQWELIQFEMTFDNKKAHGELRYNQDDQTYQLKTTQNGKEKQKFIFKRTNNDELVQLYKKQKVQSLFQTINQIVLELFVDKHKKIILPVLPKWELENYEIQRGKLTGIFLNNYYGYKHKNDFLFTVDNHTNNKKIELVYYGYNMSNLKFTHIYPAERFELETTALYIEYILNAHLDLMRANNLLPRVRLI